MRVFLGLRFGCDEDEVVRVFADGAEAQTWLDATPADSRWGDQCSVQEWETDGPKEALESARGLVATLRRTGAEESAVSQEAAKPIDLSSYPACDRVPGVFGSVKFKAKGGSR